MRIMNPMLRRVSCEHPMPAIAALGFLLAVVGVPTAQAQTPPLNFGNNYFVTGDYVVAGVGLRGLGDSTGYATGTITMPDANTVSSTGNPQRVTGVPPGAAVVAAFLYWQTVESSSTAFVGQTGYFRPVFAGGPQQPNYPITGVVLGNPNAPVAWSAGGCSGSSQGSKTIRTYRANVLPFLPVDSNGNVNAGNSTAPVAYEVRLADSGSNGGGAPLTLGATLVIVYRVLDANVPLNSIVIYDGSFAPSNTSSIFSQTVQGFYQAGTPTGSTAPISKLTQIVGNGQDNKSESVTLNGVTMPSLYGALPPFPGYYNSNGTTFDGSWDNPTWIVNSYSPVGSALLPNASSATTVVTPSPSNSGCVSWGAVILSTTVQDSDGDGLLDIWESPPPNPVNPNPAGSSPGYVDVGTGNFVALPGADPAKEDIFVEMDTMCTGGVIFNSDGTSSCDTTGGQSFLPSASAQSSMVAAFSAKHINLHLIPINAIQETPCTDDLSASPPKRCPFPNQPGVVEWKGGFEFLKYQPLNYPDETSCETKTPPGQLLGSGPTCIRRFQSGKKDSYHYALFGNALGVPNWSFVGGTLISVAASGNSVTFTTSTDPNYDPVKNPTGVVAGDMVNGYGRVTVAGVLSNFNLDGTFPVTGVTANSFTIQTDSPVDGTYTLANNPALSVTSGQGGTGSGMSDLGGEDSLITLGLWGPDGQTPNVQAGVFMHELGHTLGLSHGGIFYGSNGADAPSPGNYVPTFGANCKSNYQSIMNYLFTVDLLGPSQTLDYSEQKLNLLDETNLPAGVTTTDGSALAYSTTKWYTPSLVYGVGTAATRHCDGSPIITSGPGADVSPSMYRVEGNANPISPASEWSSTQDINFSGKLDNNLRGYNDWAFVDLRQVGSTGNFGLGGPGFGFGGPGFGFGGPGFGFGGPGFGFGGPGFGFGGPGFGFGGPGNLEVSFRTANSFVRPPRSLTATPLKSPNRIQLTWSRSTFGQVAFYNIYRGVGTIPTSPIYAQVPGGDQSQGTTHTFTDKSISCGATYNYFVTAQLTDGRESVPSNLVTVIKCVAQ